jgi:calcium-translocating P-type ATPase
MKFSFAGLSNSEVTESRNKNGSNAVTQQQVETFWDKLIANLKDPIIIILIFALIITVTLSILGYVPWYEGVGIAIAVVLATMVATWSEYSNENEFQKLLEEASLIQVKVFRSNKLLEISINDIVVNDYILLQPGDNVPTDGVLISGHVEVSQAALTGESEPLTKKPVAENAEIDEEKNKMFRASLIEDGEAVMKVLAVGDQTEYGKTLKEISTAENRLSPLQEKLTTLGGQISTFGYIGATFIAIAFMINNIYIAENAPGSIALFFSQNDWGQIISIFVTALILAIIIIVVAVPEGLPMMIAIVLSLNMRKLLKAKVLVRKLLGIETAGSLNILFTDKTGTLTKGHLVTEKLLIGSNKVYNSFNKIPQKLQDMVVFAIRNNTGAVIDTTDIKNPKIVGTDRTDQALLKFLNDRLAETNKLDMVEMISFSSARKFSAMQVTGDKNLTLVKGAPDILLKNCTHYLHENGEKIALDNQENLLQEMDKLSADAMRLLAIAISDDSIETDLSLPKNLTLIGIAGIRDGLRETSKPAVKTAQQAGIQVVMITGDAEATAQAIAKDVGLLKTDSIVLTSTELQQMSDDEIKKILPKLAVVARAYPTDKSRLVKLAKEIDLVVGMTGDGVNDAPAIKHADVGFAMGSGTEMTKEASDIVILDDNFASITQAVLYGRTLFKSIRKFLIFQLTVNVAAILLAFLGPFFSYELPLTMIQLLWINMIMDTLAALAFSGEAALSRYMLDKPIPKNEHLITSQMWSSILVNGLAITAMSLIFLAYDPFKGLFHSEAAFLTAFFGFFVFVNNFNKFNARTESLNLFEYLTDNKNFLYVVATIFSLQIIFTYLGGEVMRVVGLEPMEWLYIILFALIIIPIDLTRKFIRNKFFGNPIEVTLPN